MLTVETTNLFPAFYVDNAGEADDKPPHKDLEGGCNEEEEGEDVGDCEEERINSCEPQETAVSVSVFMVSCDIQDCIYILRTLWEMNWETFLLMKMRAVVERVKVRGHEDGGSGGEGEGIRNSAKKRFAQKTHFIHSSWTNPLSWESYELRVVPQAKN